MLRPLPALKELEHFCRRVRQVSLDGLISYGVPISSATKTVTVIARKHTIDIHDDNDELIATHQLGFKTRSILLLPGQYQKMEGQDAHPLTPARETTVEVCSLSDYEVLGV